MLDKIESGSLSKKSRTQWTYDSDCEISESRGETEGSLGRIIEISESRK